MSFKLRVLLVTSLGLFLAAHCYGLVIMAGPSQSGGQIAASFVYSSD